MFFCVDVCPSSADEEMKVTDEMCSKQTEAQCVYRQWEIASCISEMLLFRTGMRKGWPVTTQGCGYTSMGLLQET